MKLSDLPECLRGRFALKEFPNCVFVVNLRACYDDQIVVAIVTNHVQSDFARDTLSSIVKRAIPLE